MEGPLPKSTELLAEILTGSKIKVTIKSIDFRSKQELKKKKKKKDFPGFGLFPTASFFHWLWAFLFSYARGKDSLNQSQKMRLETTTKKSKKQCSFMKLSFNY